MKRIITIVMLAAASQAADVVLGRLSELSWTGTGVNKVASWEGKISAKSYIADGLFLQLDALENTGYGSFYADAVMWKDLVGTNDFTVSIEDQNNGWKFSSLLGTFGTYSSRQNITVPVPCTIENIMSTDNTDSGGYNKEFYGFNNWWAGGPRRNSFLFASTFANNGYLSLNDDNGTQTDLYFSQSVHKKTVSIVIESNGCKVFIDGTYFSYCSCQFAASLYSEKMGTHRLSPSENFASGSGVHSVRVYSRILSDDEIATNAAIDKARFGN